MFKFKEKKIVLDCFTLDPFAYEYANISPAVKYYPEWWKDLPSSGADPNMKSCLGFLNLYKNSFVVPMWGSLTINLSDAIHKTSRPELDYIIGFAPGESPLAQHPKSQFKGFVGEDFIHVKAETPWMLKTNSDIKFMYMDPLWNRSNLADYSILPGIVDYHYQPTTSINMMFKLHDQPRRVDFRPGDVMAMIVPITENGVEVKCHLVDEMELRRQFPQIRLATSTKQKMYNTFKKFITKHEERQKSKCPFGFE